MSDKYKYAVILALVLLIAAVSSTTHEVEDSLHINLQVTDTDGYILPGTYDFTFNISTNSACTDIVYNDTTTLTTDVRAVASYYLDNVVGLNWSAQHWLCYYRNGVLINTVKIARVPYSFGSEDVDDALYGEMWNYTPNGFTFPIPVAGLYYNITNLTSTKRNGFTFTNTTEELGGSYLTAEYQGRYNIMVSFSFSGGNNQLYSIGVAKNHDITTSRECYARRTTSTTNIGSLSINCLLEIAAGDTLVIQAEDEAGITINIKIYQLNLNIIRIGDKL